MNKNITKHSSLSKWQTLPKNKKGIQQNLKNKRQHETHQLSIKKKEQTEWNNYFKRL